ncbi:MAG: hypothetical protein PVI26_06065 [Chitinispirillia bacterium]|jgi:hypothetical protein
MFQLPGNQTAIIGSMPYVSADEAFNILSRFPLTIPTWYQLPKRSFKENMTIQYSRGLPGLVIDEENKRQWIERNDDLLNTMTSFYEDALSDNTDSFAISEEYANGLYHFVNKLKALSHKIPTVKGQVTGPFSYGLSLNDNLGKAVWYDEQYRDIIIKQLINKALWQIKILSKYAEKIILFFDEPIFSALGTPAYIGIEDETVISVLNELAFAIQNEYVAVGIHCCGNMDWSLLTQTSIDIIAFDAYEFGDKIALYPEAINKFLDRGGVLAWGIVPTGNNSDIQKESFESLKEKENSLMDLYEKKGISIDLIQNRIIYTPSCGMGTLSFKDSEKVLDLLAQIGNPSGIKYM